MLPLAGQQPCKSATLSDTHFTHSALGYGLWRTWEHESVQTPLPVLNVGPSTTKECCDANPAA